MKYRLEPENRKGMLRWYLVKSEYIPSTGKRRNRKRYLGPPPSDEMRKLVASFNRSSISHDSFIKNFNDLKSNLQAIGRAKRKAESVTKARRKRAQPHYDKAAKHLLTASDCNKKRRKASISALNGFRDVGELINFGSGRSRLIFNATGIEFCRREILPLMPIGTTIDHLKACVALASNIPTKIRSYEDFARLELAFRPYFKTLGIAINR